VLQEARVHGVMNAPEPPSQPGRPAPRAVAQHVFELIRKHPCKLLYSLTDAVPLIQPVRICASPDVI
jgi:hypothetical protein